MKRTSVRPSVRLSVCPIVRQQERRAAAACTAGRRLQAPALSSKRGQRHVDSGRRRQTEHGVVQRYFLLLFSGVATGVY